MKGAVASLALFASFAAGVQPAAAAAVDRSEFRYQRALVAEPGGAPILIEPDGAMFEHSQPGFADLRIVDGRDQEVAWRRGEQARGTAAEQVTVLNSGRQGRYAVGLLDLGAVQTIRDRVALEVPGRDFTGRAVVLGADDRDGPFVRLSETGIYDVGGAQPARSTVAVFPPSDYRYLLVKATRVSRITGATVSGTDEQAPLLRRSARSISQRRDGTRTIVTLDLGHGDVPVDELRVTAADGHYERPVLISGSNFQQQRFTPLTTARILRFPGSASAPVPIDAHHRYIRIEIENGDDPPLRRIDVSAWARSRAIVLEGGHPRPLTAHYGNPRASAPSYDFARLPTSAIGLEDAKSAQLGPERETPTYEPPPDTRTFTARNPVILTAALALAALAVGAVGLLALRRG